METLTAADVMAAPVYDVEGLVNDPQYQARGALVEVEHPHLGKLQFQGPVPKLSLTPGRVESAAPLLGGHNDYVYGQLLGYSAEEIGQLREEGVI